ncbi:hypothetical protein AMATHDRAFT_73878 [Amanita thiersii Skay4041]|uniref:PX domain-containing protein n=1 Tax=Amanita thiersii Skay4041 TaxID=703135 RepID=A0A2A9NXS5_9AGAR|nr:hypothetical protein AMATHDRAFT_73878 [Amanita thiersii Skay4041]
MDDAVLTPVRAHYLKKALVLLQFRHELALISSTDPPFNTLHPNAALIGTSTSSISTLSYLGLPFTPPPKNAPFLDLPFLRYIFRQFVMSFPFLAAAPKDFYSAKLQPFIASVLARGIAMEDGVSELLVDHTENKKSQDNHHQHPSHHKLLAKLERHLALFLGATTRLIETEQVVRLSQTDLDRLDNIATKRSKRNKDVVQVNVVCVRTVIDKGRVRSRAHQEFIVKTSRTGQPDVYVSRRYGDFRTLAKELAKAHPDEHIRQPPQKDKTLVSAPPSAAMSPLSPSYTQVSMTLLDHTTNGFPTSVQSPTPSRLAREKNRLTLRAYLHSLMSSSIIASSPVLRSFLLSGPTTLTEEERDDVKAREEADRLREEGRKKFAKEIADRVDGLRDAIKSVKGDIMGKDGLTHVFATIKVTPDVRDLPDNYKSVIEWARISLASTIFHQFVASDNASETFASLKRIHGLMPYFMLKAALKISNPVAMIRSVLDLFLAQPFGGKSLLQRMCTGSLTEEVRALQEEIEHVKDKVDDPVMCAKVRQFVYAPRDIQEMFKLDAASNGIHILIAILRSAEGPVLSRPQMHRLARAHRAYTAYVKHRASLADSDSDDGPQDEDAWLIEDLKVLTHLHSRLRDREQLIELIFEGFTADLLKDIITIFYAPLAQVYKAASIADSFNDLQNFINDLIKTVEQVEELSQEDPHRTVQAFIDLVQRHEQSFYHFVHKVHSKGEGLFDSLMRWIELFLNVTREGLGEPISLEFLLPHTGKERQDILSEVDKVALYHYKLKVLYEDKLRRRFRRAQSQSDANAEDEATQTLVNDVVGEISFGELAQADADEVAAEGTDDSDTEEESSEYDSISSSEDTDSRGHAIGSTAQQPSTHAQQGQQSRQPMRSQTITTPQAVSQLEGQRRRTLSLKSSRSMTFSTSVPRPNTSPHTPPVPPLPIKEKKKKTLVEPPELIHIPKLLPVFVEMVSLTFLTPCISCLLTRTQMRERLRPR